MWLRRALIGLTLGFSCSRGVACDCGNPGPACSLVSDAEVVFLGMPVFTNHDNSRGFVQKTLYQFQVEEVYKGLLSDTKEVWIDPGSNKYELLRRV